MYMVERTGTLWENIQDHASLNHGFASHVVVTLYRDILGAYRIDPVKKEVHIRLPEIDLPWCGGAIPIDDALLELQWRHGDDGIALYYIAPPDFTVTIENATNRALTQVDAPLF